MKKKYNGQGCSHFTHYRNVNLKRRDTILNLSEWQKMLSLVTASIDTDMREN